MTRKRPTIAYLEQRVERASEAVRIAKGSKVKGELDRKRRTWRLAVARLAAERPAA